MFPPIRPVRTPPRSSAIRKNPQQTSTMTSRRARPQPSSSPRPQHTQASVPHHSRGWQNSVQTTSPQHVVTSSGGWQHVSHRQQHSPLQSPRHGNWQKPIDPAAGEHPGRNRVSVIGSPKQQASNLPGLDGLVREGALQEKKVGIKDKLKSMKAGSSQAFKKMSTVSSGTEGDILLLPLAIGEAITGGVRGFKRNILSSYDTQKNPPSTTENVELKQYRKRNEKAE